MIDRRNRGRIIDFGSVTGMTGTNRFKPVDNKCKYYFIQVVLQMDTSFLFNNQSTLFLLLQADIIEANFIVIEILINTV